MILYAPDSYGGFLTAPEAVALAQQVQPTPIGHPMADGGEGSLATLAWHHGQHMETVSVHGPYGVPVQARLGFHDGACFVETAEACGLRLTAQRTPRQASTDGVGERIRAAQQPMVIGLGGSATIDGGAGMIAALQGDPHGIHAANLGTLKLDAQLPMLSATALLDVLTPLAECCTVVGLQKGLSDAAGGLGFALAALGAELASGAAYFAKNTALEAAVQKADAVVIGEGRLDHTSHQGKVAGVVTGLARAAGVAVWAVVGRCRATPPPPLGPDRIVEIGETNTSAFQDAIRRLIR